MTAKLSINAMTLESLRYLRNMASDIHTPSKTNSPLDFLISNQYKSTVNCLGQHNSVDTVKYMVAQ